MSLGGEGYGALPAVQPQDVKLPCKGLSTRSIAGNAADNSKLRDDRASGQGS